MPRTLWRGAVAGTVIGVVIAVGFAILAFGSGDGTSGLLDDEALPGLYFIAVVVGAVVGAVTGAAGLSAAVLVARASTGTPASRRLRGALAAAACSAVVSMFTMAWLFGPGLFAALAAGVLGGAAAWLLLPSQIDPSTPPRPIIPPAQPSADPESGMSAVNRGVITIVVAGGGSFLVANIVMTIISGFAYVKRDIADVVALIILGIAFVVIAVTLWRYLARRQPTAPATRP